MNNNFGSSTYATRSDACEWVPQLAGGSGSISIGLSSHAVAYEKNAAMYAAESFRKHTGGALQYQYLVLDHAPLLIDSAQKTASNVLSLKDKISNIRSVFGLSVTQMAEVMGVERVTVYDWMRKNTMDSVRGNSRERINAINDLATTWGQFPALGGKFLFETLPDGTCVMNLLSTLNLDSSAVLRAYALLASKKKPGQRIQEHRITQAQNAKGIGTALRNAFQQLEGNSKSKDSV